MKPDPSPELHMVYGKVAAGKSTLAAKLGELPNSVLITEDQWLNLLFSDQMQSLEDYVSCAKKLRKILASHLVSLLNAGVTVVLDFPANTEESRRWMRDILAQTRAAHTLHILDVPDNVCLERLHRRNASGAHPFSVTEAQFERICAHMDMPSEDEGFNIVWHRADDKD
ncbi:AAA family ATPase [Roseovarius phycicola]|uniref:ATP-binding protein n=1 Tax=Roseovarius phycicola TaxID=3080976 RepID=A0ABZ2HIP0_9RHOB